MNLQDYFIPVDVSVFHESEFTVADSLWNDALIYTDNFPDLSKARLAIIAVEESRGSQPAYSAENSALQIRKQFYTLKKHTASPGFADLGTFKNGSKLNDTLIALSGIIAELVRMKIVPIIVGGSQDLTYAHYLAYKQLEQIINIAAIDSRFDLGTPADTLNSSSWLGKIVLDQPNFLFNYSHIAYQTYFVGNNSVDMMNNLYFDTYRTGVVKSNLREIEPVIRNADVISFDISSIKQSDAPAAVNSSPNGLTGEESCQLMQYAGMSDKLSGIGIYQYNPKSDNQNQTAALIAQMIWYFLEGFNNRMLDLPEINQQSFTLYRVTNTIQHHELLFLKSAKTGRWWIEIPIENSKRKISRHHFMPCSENDYETALKSEIPDRWWQTLKKIS